MSVSVEIDSAGEELAARLDGASAGAAPMNAVYKESSGVASDLAGRCYGEFVCDAWTLTLADADVEPIPLPGGASVEVGYARIVTDFLLMDGCNGLGENPRCQAFEGAALEGLSMLGSVDSGGSAIVARRHSRTIRLTIRKREPLSL